ncbi:hypothetical protein PAHAL_1G327200 [Panicum hallii]|jgi:hypothetical protein|uniref:Uncharacterized protein n=1 Tax=Panicum hallii TaxID=206008 RepID=A0A2S3GRL4_9POAL|nr:hypothetical protein PAHAL_1G327200 [Panicum hallii]
MGAPERSLLQQNVLAVAFLSVSQTEPGVSDEGTAALQQPGSVRLRLARPRRRAAGGARRARREPALHAGAVEPVPARREHADAPAARQLRQTDGALRLAPLPCCAGGACRYSGARGVGGAARELGLIHPRRAAAREAAEDEARRRVEGEGEQGDAGQDDENGGHVGEEGPGAGVGAPRPRGGRRRPRGRRRRGDHGRRRGLRHGGRGCVVGPALHGLASSGL